VGLNFEGGTGGKIWYLVQQGSSDDFTFWDSNGDAARLTLKSGGNIGIGVADPDHDLELAGILHVSNEVSSPSAPSSGDGGCVYVKSDGKLYFISDTVAETALSDSSGGSGTVTSVTMSSDSGSTSAITSSGTFTIAGTSTEIETSATGTTVTIGLPDDVVVASSLTSTGPVIQQAGLRVKFAQLSAAGPTTLDGTYHIVDVNASSNTVAIALPRSSTTGAGRVYRIQDFASSIGGTGNSITVTCDSNDNTGGGGSGVGGADTKTITTSGGHIWIISNGSNGWGILTSNL